MVNVRLGYVVSSSIARSRTVCSKYCGLCELCMSSGFRLLFVSQLYELYDLVEMRVDRVVMYDSCHLL